MQWIWRQKWALYYFLVVLRQFSGMPIFLCVKQWEKSRGLGNLWVSWSRKGSWELPRKCELLDNCCSHLKWIQPFPFWEGLGVTGLAKFSLIQSQAIENCSPQLFANVDFVIRKLKETGLFSLPKLYSLRIKGKEKKGTIAWILPSELESRGRFSWFKLCKI